MLWPSTFGIDTSGGPFDTVIVTVSFWVIGVLAAGDCWTIVPCGWSLLAACSSGSGGTSSNTSTSTSTSTSGAAAAGTPQAGGTLNYLVDGLLSEWDLGLDPAIEATLEQASGQRFPPSFTRVGEP